MEMWHAIVARRVQVLLGLATTALLFAALHLFLDEYVTVLAGAGGAGAGYLLAQRGTSGDLDAARIDDAFAWGFGALIGSLAMHGLVQGGML